MFKIGWGKTGSLLKALNEVAGVTKTGQFGYLGNFVVGVFQQGHGVIDSNLIQIIVEIDAGLLLEQESKIGSVDVVLIAEVLNGYILRKVLGHILHGQ